MNTSLKKSIFKKLANLGHSLSSHLGLSSDLDNLSSRSEHSSDHLTPAFFADLLCYKLFDEQHLIYENTSSFGFVIEMAPLLGASDLEDQEVSLLIKELGEEGSTIQTLLFADYRIDRFLEAWKKPRLQQGPLFEQLSHKKELFFKTPFPKGDAPPRIFRFFFSYTEPKADEEHLHRTLDRLVEKRAKALDVLNRISGKSATLVSPLRLIEITSGLINYNQKPLFNVRREWNKDDLISKSIPNRGAVMIQPQGLTFYEEGSQSFLKTYEVIDYPQEWSLPMMGELLGDFFNKSYRLSSPFYLHYGIHFPPQGPVESKFRRKAQIVDHQIQFPSLVKLFPDMPREHQEHLFVHKQLLDGEKFVETRLSCGIWSSSCEEMEPASGITSLFQKYGFKLQSSDFMHLPNFLSSLPMAWGEIASKLPGLKRTQLYRTTLSHETATLVPLVGEWWGNSHHGMILMGRKGQITCWDPFKTEGNFNTVVVGPSGSGKSVFMQELLVGHLGQGDRVFILDLGRSFEKLCHLFQGQHLEFSSTSKLNLNPFSFVKETQESLDMSLEMVAHILATMASPSHAIDRKQAALLSRLVKLAWNQKGKEASVDTVIDLLKGLLSSHEYNSELMRGATEHLIEELKKFGQQGSYAKYFYGAGSIDLSQNLVVIETEELKGMPDLQAVILQIFMLTIANQVFMGSRERRSLICIDEAWDLLKSPQMEGFIEGLARRLRKYNGALVVGTQSVKDFERSYGAKAAYQNSNWLCILGKDSDLIQTIKKENLLTLDPFKERALESLRMEEGKYSEVALYNKGTGFFSIHQLKLDPFSAMLYSTKADEFQAVQELQRKGLGAEEALNWMVLFKAEFRSALKQGLSVKAAVTYLIEAHPKATQDIKPPQGETHVQ